MIWSDEATFTVTGNRGGKVRMRPDADTIHLEYTDGTVKHPDSVIYGVVWDAFGYHRVGKLIALPKNVTVNRYLVKGT